MLVAACDNMVDQPRVDDPYGESPVYGLAAQPLNPEAIPVGMLGDDEHLTFGTIDGVPAEEIPVELSEAMFARGENLYEGFCAPCHGFSGYGNGVLSEEGFSVPASYHSDELVDAPVGRLYQAITNGVANDDGTMNMFSYASRIAVEDRWAIVAYIRALQMSQNLTFDELSAEMQAEFQDEGE